MLKNALVTVFVTDFDRAVRFYTETLELKLTERHQDHWAQVTGAGITIGLHPAGADGLPSDPNRGMSIGFNVDDLDAARSALRAKGVEFTGESTEAPVHLAHFTDPDGTPLYLCQQVGF